MTFLRGLAIFLIVLVFGVFGGLYAIQDRMLFHPQTEQVAPTLPYIQAIEIETEDRERLVAWYSKAEPGCPTLLHFHGNGSRIDLDRRRFSRLNAQGVGFLAVSWRGYAGSTGKPSEAGFHKDATAAWAWLANKGLPANDVIIHGFSIGSGPATKLASEVDEGLVILEAPFFSMLDLISKKARLVPVGLLLKHKFRSDRYAASLGSPVIMVHGTVDQIIPIEQSKRLFELANEPKAHHAIEGGDHNTLVRDGLYDAVWPFIAAHWTPDTSAAAPSRCYLAANLTVGDSL